MHPKADLLYITESAPSSVSLTSVACQFLRVPILMVVSSQQKFRFTLQFSINMIGSAAENKINRI